MVDIKLQKKKQRNLSTKNRLILHLSNREKNFSFDKTLNQNYWFEKSRVVASFISIKSEISTISLNKFIRESGKTLCLPVITNNKEEALIFKEYREGVDLVASKFGVMEPLNSKSYLPEIIFVPCLAYDKCGFRLGYGGGYYDKTISYFHAIKHSFLTVGLAYDNQKIDRVLHDHLDQRLDYILTEKQLYKIL